MAKKNVTKPYLYEKKNAKTGLEETGSCAVGAATRRKVTSSTT